MLKQLVTLSFLFFTLNAPAFSSANKLYENMLSICIEDQPEELCICVANSFRNVLESAGLSDIEYEQIYQVQNGQAEEESLLEIDKKIDYDVHYKNTEECATNFESIE